MGSCFIVHIAKSVSILFPKVKGTIYHIVFVTFLSRVLSGITTTHRQPSLIIETGKHQNQPRTSLLCSELESGPWVRDSCLFLDDTGPSLKRFITPGPWQVATLFVRSSVICLFFLYLQPPGKVLTKVKKNYFASSQMSWMDNYLILILFDSFHYQVC